MGDSTMNKWKILGVNLALGAALALTGCGGKQSGGGQAEPDSSTIIGFAHCCVRGNISTMDKVEDVIKQEAAKRGVKLLFATAEESKHKDDLTIQVNQVKSMIDEGAKVIILITANAKGMAGMQKEIVEYANSKGVKIVAARRPLPTDVHINFANAVSVSSAADAAGIFQGKMTYDLWKKHPEWDKNGDAVIQYGLLQGLEGNPKTLARTNSFIKAVSMNDQKTERVASEYTNWERPIAKDLVAKWIASGEINKMEIIVGNSDDVALGALDAFREAGKQPLPIVGINAIDEAQQAIKNGEIVGSILQDVPEQGRVAYRVAENLALGKAVTDGISMPLEGGHTINVPYTVVTAENVDQFLKK